MLLPADVGTLLDTMEQARTPNYQERVVQLAKENDHINQNNLDMCFTALLNLVRGAEHDGHMLLWYMA